jgi:hypothetical protein
MAQRSRDSFGWIKGVKYAHNTYTPPPLAADLDAVEAELGAKLPASYRSFALQFGLGGTFYSLPELLFLTPTRGRPDQSWARSLVTATMFHRIEGEECGVASAEFLQHAVVFGIDGGMDTFLFHTAEVTAPGLLEYRIYDIPRHEEPIPIAESFAEWLEWVDDHFGPRAGLEYDDGWLKGVDENGRRLIFDPDSFDEEPMPYWRTALHTELL